MTTALVTGADARYGTYLLNLLGSVRVNSDLFDRLVAYDLGLTRFQRHLLEAIPGVEVRTVPPFVPHWRQGFTWKTWVWTHCDVDTLFWLDAGVTVLRPLSEAIAQARERGYFLVSAGRPMADIVPSDYISRYGLTESELAQVCVAAGIIAFRRSGDFYSRVIVPTYEDACEGLSLGFSLGEVEKLNFGLDPLVDPPIRDCPIFRHDQTLLGIHLFKEMRDPVVNNVYRYGGWTSPADHPRQVIWSHRRRGDMRYLPRVPYSWPVWPVGRAWGSWTYLRTWRRDHAWAFRPSTYLRKSGLAR